MCDNVKDSNALRDQGGIRVLRGASFTSTTMTPAACMNLCTPGNFAFAGVEFHNVCISSYPDE